ncbi:glycoside hydrolase family 2 protein [Actinoplanes sp. NPDC051411]|uniref:glycoside hydrolase family 2 protein n=1 Tax=Actinoplanes sp. NPDC051411 TaxID=3155522 RepID=UPI00342655B1
MTAPAGQALHLVRLEMRDNRDNVLSENTYWRYQKGTDMQVLTSMPKARLAVSTSGVKRSGDDDQVTTTVTNRGSTVAALIRLAVRDSHGDRVLPVRYDDNYFWLLPGESRKVTVSWPSRLGCSHGVQVSAEAYNA